MASIFSGLFRSSSSGKKNEERKEEEDDGEMEDEPMTQLPPINNNSNNNNSVESPLRLPPHEDERHLSGDPMMDARVEPPTNANENTAAAAAVPHKQAAHPAAAAAAKASPLEQQQQEHVQFRHGAFYSADEAAAAMAVQPPEMDLNRIRSLSKVFTVLPATLPSYQQMVADHLEFLSHILLLETSSDRLLKTKQDYEVAVSHFVSLSEGKELLKAPGRLHSRCLLAALVADLHLVQPNPEGDGSEQIQAPVTMSANDWKCIREKLMQLRGTLLQKNANFPMGMLASEGSAEEDAQSAQHPMMTEDFDHVLKLLDVQCELAAFRANLKRIAQHGRGFSKNNKAVEQTVNEYIRNLTRLFPATTASPAAAAEDSEEDDLFDNDDDMDTSQSSVTANIPKELNSFVLTDLYHPKKQEADGSMVDRLIEHVQSLTEDTAAPTGTTPGPYSYANLLASARKLLIKWSESLLEVPALVQLQYGGVTSPIVARHDDASFSSWGETPQDHDSSSLLANPFGRGRSRTNSRAHLHRGPTEEESLDQARKPAAAAVSTKEMSTQTMMEEEDKEQAPAVAEPMAAHHTASTEKAPTAAPTPADMLITQAAGVAADAVQPTSPAATIQDPSALQPRPRRIPRKKPKHNLKDPFTPPTLSAGEVQAAEDLEPQQQQKRSVAKKKTAAEKRCQTINNKPKRSAETKKLKSATGETKKKTAVARSKERASSSSSSSSSDDDTEKDVVPPIDFPDPYGTNSLPSATARKKRMQSTVRDKRKQARSYLDFSLDDDDDDDDSGARRTPKRARRSLGKENSSSKKEKVTKTAKRSLKKKETKQVVWSSSDEDDYALVQKVEQPTKQKKPRKKAVPFSRDEVAAIKEGLQLFGAGHWQEMKDNDKRLKNRSNIQIKDKYRTMVDNNEI